jgi:polyhydroxyalkanoate synthase subunit PhaC
MDKMQNKQQAQPMRLPDFEQLSQNLARLVEESGKAAAAYMKPIESGHSSASDTPAEIGDMVRTIGHVAESWFVNPEKAMEAQGRLTNNFIDLWASTLKKMQGESAEPVATPDARDKRFHDADWSDNPLFDFIKQAYLLTSRWAETMVDEADEVDDVTRRKARFYVKQLSSAFSPSNFLATNPELIRETLSQNGDNLVRGMKMLAEDVEAGAGELRIRQTDLSKYEVGVNLAITPGKVIFRNDIMELIQYAPTTPSVFKRPLLIVPPWINKYYILDLTPEKSFISWAVDQGLTVFCISWVNPDEHHAHKDFGSYMREGIFDALTAIEAVTGEKKVSAIGYCVGGTLLSCALSYMKARGDDRIESATLFTTQVDFSEAGDLKVFIDDKQIGALEESMKQRGYLEGARMANAFNMLRPNDLIWPYVINTYLKGQAPFPFDLLYWNSDSTRMTAANHAYYLRHCYLQNDVMEGRALIDGVKVDLSSITIPIMSIATKEDHIAPASSVFFGSTAFGGTVDFVLAGSGHIAGIVNPPSRAKYQYWTGNKPQGELENWLSGAKEHEGSWWPYWLQWMSLQAPDKVHAREPGSGPLPALCDAPGTYVKAR